MKKEPSLESCQQVSVSLYEALIECDRVIIRSKNPDDMFGDICRHLVQLGNVDAVWMGSLEVETPRLWPRAQHCKNGNSLEFPDASLWLDVSPQTNPMSLALRTHQAVWLQDMAHDPVTPALREQALAQGWGAGAWLPLMQEGRPMGVLVIYASAVNSFDAGTQKLLTQLASNISYALDNFQRDNQRRLAEENLLESEVRYRMLFENNGMPMLLISPDDGRIVDANNRATDFYGWSRATMTSMKVMDMNVLSPEEIRQEMALAASTRKIFFNFRHRLANGEIRDVEVFSSPISFDGEVYLLSMVHDVTEIRRDLVGAKNMQVLVQQFFDEFPGAIYLKDSQLRLLMVNKSVGRELGVDPKTLIGKTAHDIFPKEFADVITDLDQQMLLDGGRRTVDESFHGRHHETSMFVMESPLGDRVLGGLSIDVTERYRAAELATVLLQINELGSLLEEKDLLNRGLEMAQALTRSEIGFLHFVNDDQETLELVTWTAGALQGCTAAFDAHYPVSQAGIWANCLREKKAVVFNDYASFPDKHGLPEGHTILTRLISAPVMENGMVRMMLGVGNKAENYEDTDVDTLSLIGNDLWRIVRRAHAENLLNKRVEELLETNRKLAETQMQLLQSEKMASIGQLAAGVAHEINNPIGFVKSNLGMLAQNANDLLALLNDYAEAEKQLGEAHVDLFAAVNQRKEASDFEFVAADLPKLIEESREGVSRVSRIVQDLKNFSRAGDNEWQWADLHTGIESTINVVWNQLKYKAVMTRAYGELPQVFCVASQINQVVMNLLVNAGQAILEHGHITVRTGTEGDMVWIEVQDDGCGISAENQAKIFEPFYTSKPVGQGTGLGLSIASGIISRHQGTILLRSVLGVGTTFRIVLPINSHAVDAAQPTQTLDTKAGTP